MIYRIISHFKGINYDNIVIKMDIAKTDLEKRI